jgi:uncharacterized protein (TIGR02147 family)
MKNIYEYIDYRLFLHDAVENRKKEKSWFSYRYMATKINMDHSNLIKILLGKRHASRANVSAICDFFKFNQKESEYFQTLVEFNKTKNQVKSRLLLEKLFAIKNVSFKTVEPYQYDYYRRWYHTAIYSLLDYYDFRGDYASIAKELNPAITSRQAKESIELLEKLKLIRKDDSGRYVQADKLITTGNSWHSIAIRNFQEETLNLAINSLHKHPGNVRNISTLTISLTQADMMAIKEITEQYRKSIIKVVNESGPGNTVYQLNMQIFPLTKTKWSIP